MRAAHGARRRSLLVVCLAGFVLAPHAAVAQAPEAEGLNVRASDNQRLVAAAEGPVLAPLRGRDLVGLAVDPADPAHIVEVEEEFLSGQCAFHVTFDGGGRWEGGNLEAPEGFLSPPCPVFDSNGYAHSAGSVVFGSGGNVYTTFSSAAEGGGGDTVLVARSADGGRTFETATVAIPGVATGEGQPAYIRPEIGVEPRTDGDRVYVSAWGLALVDDEITAARVVTAVSADGGLTWSSAVDVTAPGGRGREQSPPAVGPDGAVYVAWRTLDAAPTVNRLVVAKSTDGGGTWTTVGAAPVSGTRGSDPKVAVDPAGTVHVAYTFNAASVPGNENPEESGASDPDILALRSVDGGATWSPPVRVNDDIAVAGADPTEQHLAEISVAPDGRVDLAWHDTRHAYPGPAESNDIYYAYSADQGQTFSANQRVTDRTINLDVGLDGRIGTTSFYTPGLASLDEGSAVVAWADTRQGNFLDGSQDIYFATVELGADGPVPVVEVDAATATGDIALSQLSYPGGNQRVDGDPGTKVVIVADGDVAAALAAAPLARANYGPVLVSPASGLPEVVAEEVVRLDASGAFVIGREEVLSADVVTDLVDAGLAEDSVVRIEGGDDAAIAAAVAQALATTPRLSDDDLEDLEEEGTEAPTLDEAVIVNPEDPVAAFGASLAAARRLPVLFAEPGEVPPATAEALASLPVERTLVVAGATSIGEAALGALPSPTRLEGDDVETLSGAVAEESAARGLPTNLVYLADTDQPMAAAVMAASTARLGGLMLAGEGTGAGAAAALDGVAVAAGADRVVVVVTTPAGRDWLPVVLAVAFAAAGAVFVALALRRSRPST